MVISSPLTLYDQTVALSDRPSILVVRHEPEIAFDPAGPFATRVASPLPVTGGPPFVLLLSLKENITVLLSDKPVEVEFETPLPLFLSASPLAQSFTTR